MTSELGRYLGASRCHFLQVDPVSDQVILLQTARRLKQHGLAESVD